jgi:hypothetical protein
MKTDYLKGITAGLSLRKKSDNQLMKHGFRFDKFQRANAESKVEQKYRESLLKTGVPNKSTANYGTLEHEALAYIRTGYFMQGVKDAMDYGTAQLFGVFHYDGTGYYNTDKLADSTVFTDPSKANLRAWELDPNGHAFTSMALHYVHRAKTGG